MDQRGRDTVQGRVVRVFISSTFRDMQAEREELVKRVFPALRKLCESRGAALTEVDLRWGVTDEQKAEGRVLPICLAEIRNCRPFFLCFLGERYGWVPEIDAGTMERDPWLKEARGRSVTELEVLHGVLNDPSTAACAFFYFRDPGYLERLGLGEDREAFLSEGPEAASRLKALKDRIRASGLPVREGYRDVAELGRLVARDLAEVVDRLFPEGAGSDPLDLESFGHEAFASSRRRVYVGRREWFARLDAHAEGSGPPLVLPGESGLGKSALLANWARRWRLDHPEEVVLEHFVGATAGSTDWRSLVWRVLGELKRLRGLREEVPEEPEALRPALARFLRQACQAGRIVLVIDGLDQLEDRDQALDLAWLPRELHQGARVVLSTLPGRTLDEAGRRGWPSFAISRLDEAERLAVIEEHLGQYRKSLAPRLAGRIAQSPAAANPMFLRTLLEELRLFGAHERLEERVSHYLAAADSQELFGKVLERLEADYEAGRPGLVAEAMSLLWAARRGLGEAELLDLLGSGAPLAGAVWSALYLAAEPFLITRSGLLGFHHDHLRAAAARRYLPDEAARAADHELQNARRVLTGLGVPQDVLDGINRVKARLQRGMAGRDPAQTLEAEMDSSSKTAGEIGQLMGRIAGLLRPVHRLQYDLGIFCARLSLCARIVRAAGGRQDEHVGRMREIYSKEAQRAGGAFIGILVQGHKEGLLAQAFPQDIAERLMRIASAIAKEAPFGPEDAALVEGEIEAVLAQVGFKAPR